MLNSSLYRALVGAFKHVKIAKEGQPLAYDIVNTVGKNEYVIRDYGETYRVCCPFCAAKTHADTRFRLWISHAWGTCVGNKRMWSLATCFHSDCLSNKIVRDALIDMVFGPAASRHRPAVVQGCPGSPPPPVPEWPGSCIPISSLSNGHHARRYLVARGFDPDLIGQRYNVRYCYDSDAYPLAMDRLVIPIIYEGTIRGWQCRYIGMPSKRVPKYLSAPGMQIKRYLYDYDVAAKCDRLVLVEGVMDAWAIGDGAVALFGKTLSSHQQQLIGAAAASTVVVFLDPDAASEREALYAMLAGTGKRVVCVRDPVKDPADLGTAACRMLIEAACRAG